MFICLVFRSIFSSLSFTDHLFKRKKMFLFLPCLYYVNCHSLFSEAILGVYTFWSVSRFWAKPQWLMQLSSSLTGVNHNFINWTVIFLFFWPCGEMRKPQNLEECLRGVQGVPLESSVNDCSESCCLVGLH